jgi:putative heme-binding domain-containing protein
LPDVQNGLRRRDFENGRRMFAAATCFKCHRFDGQGGIIGPDLTGVGKRFDYKYLLESIIDPNKTISDQYQATVFVLENGQTVIGKVANLSNDKMMVITNMLEPGNFTDVRPADVEEQFPSPVSMMPTALVDTLSREEILDLLAYLRSEGDPKFEAFQK